MLADVINDLACPLCGERVALAQGVVRCSSGHSFDVARHGYVSMLWGDAHTGTADSSEMVEARDAFFAAGHFAPLTGAIARVVAERSAGVSGCVVDAGAGTGHHLAGALDRIPDRAGVALDISKHAARRAARAHVRIGSVVCDTWRRLPVRDRAAAAVLDVFAPRNATEFRRILAPGGVLVVVTPTEEHLAEVSDSLGLISIDEHKPDRVEAALAGLFEPAGEERLEYRMDLSREEISGLVRMGPSSRHVTEQELAERVSNLPERVSVTSSTVVSIRTPAP